MKQSAHHWQYDTLKLHSREAVLSIEKCFCVLYCRSLKNLQIQMMKYFAPPPVKIDFLRCNCVNISRDKSTMLEAIIKNSLSTSTAATSTTPAVATTSTASPAAATPSTAATARPSIATTSTTPPSPAAATPPTAEATARIYINTTTAATGRILISTVPAAPAKSRRRMSRAPSTPRSQNLHRWQQLRNENFVRKLKKTDLLSK